MVYVARRQIKCVDREDKVTVYNPGDVIPDFEAWNIHAKRAHLNLDMVELKKVQEEVQSKKKKNKHVASAQ